MLGVFLYHYIQWHYSRAIVDIAGIVLNFRWFFHEFFGVSRHLKTFFVPFRRLREKAVDIFDLENFFESIVVTLLMRVVGMVLRSVVILLGLFLEVLAFLVGGVFLLVWLFVPFILLSLIISGAVLLFHW
jgi:hypothetical protein